MFETFIYLLVSGFMIWFIEKQKIFEILFFNDFLKELRKCGICLGFWVCLVFYFLSGNGLLANLDVNLYTHVLNVLITAAVSSFTIFLVRKGYEMVYGVTRL